MKKAMAWLFVAALVVFVIAWGVMGIKLLNGEYEIGAEAYTGLVCIVVIGVCGMYRSFNRKCPHCGKARWGGGEFCSYCGKRIE